MISKWCVLRHPFDAARTLLRPADIGREAGLRHIYAGNLLGRVEDYEATRCSKCNHPLIRRLAYTITEYQIAAQGACPKCGAPVAGVWTAHPETVNLHGQGIPRAAFSRICCIMVV